jgi:hypothetical protein
MGSVICAADVNSKVFLKEDVLPHQRSTNHRGICCRSQCLMFAAFQNF